MVITLICDVYGEENNGTTITAKRLMDGLEKRGHTVRMVSTYKNENDPKFYTVPPRSFGIFDNYIRSNGVKLAKKDINTVKSAVAGADVVHIMLPFKTGKIALPILKEMDIPFTTAFHAQPENVTSHLRLQHFKPANEFMYRYFRRKLYDKADFIHCPSDFIKNELDEHKYKAKKWVISNGVIPDFHKIQSEKPEEFKDKFCILFSGRYSREKRHDLLIDAVRKSKYKDKIQLIFAGCGPLKNKLEKLSADLPNKPAFKFMTKQELNRTINFCDLYVHPADIEIEAISCLEAITCGLVPIISDSKKSATNHFALHDCNLFKAGNSDDLAQKIDYFIEHEEEKEKLQDEYIEYAKQFEIERCVDKMVEMFEECISEHKKAKKAQSDKK